MDSTTTDTLTARPMSASRYGQTTLNAQGFVAAALTSGSNADARLHLAQAHEACKIARDHFAFSANERDAAELLRQYVNKLMEVIG